MPREGNQDVSHRARCIEQTREERVDKGGGSRLLGLGIESLDRQSRVRAPGVLIIALTMTFLGLFR